MGLDGMFGLSHPIQDTIFLGPATWSTMKFNSTHLYKNFSFNMAYSNLSKKIANKKNKTELTVDNDIIYKVGLYQF